MWLVVDSEGYGLRFVQLGESTPPPLAAGETAYYTEFPFNNTQWRELVAISRAGVSLGTGDGQRTLFDLPSAPVVEVTVFLDGTPVTSGVEVDGATGSIEFVSPPANGVAITASYVELANRPVAYMTASKHLISADGNDKSIVTFVVEDPAGVGLPTTLEVAVLGTSRQITLTNGVGTQEFASTVPIVFEVEVQDKRVVPVPDRLTVEAV